MRDSSSSNPAHNTRTLKLGHLNGINPFLFIYLFLNSTSGRPILQALYK